MKTLLIMRHAKSSWDNAALSDYERPLNERGRRAAPLIGEFIRKNSLQPDAILSSPARRAEQTALIVKDAAQIAGEIDFNHKIYEASPARLLEIIAGQNENFNSILLIGHNPGLEGLIKILTGELCSMPTAALAIIDTESGVWNEIAVSKGHLRDFIRPKEIEALKSV